MPGAVAQGKFGKRSVILALAAFTAGALAIAIMVAMPSDTSQSVQNVATGFFMAVFLLAGPLAHVTGFVFGIMALARSNDNRALGLLWGSSSTGCRWRRGWPSSRQWRRP